MVGALTHFSVVYETRELISARTSVFVRLALMRVSEVICYAAAVSPFLYQTLSLCSFNGWCFSAIRQNQILWMFCSSEDGLSYESPVNVSCAAL